MKYNLILPSNFKYSCKQCGKCCNEWDVPISEEEALKLNNINWNEEFLKNNMNEEAEIARSGIYNDFLNTNIIYENLKYLKYDSSLRYVIKKKSDNRCIFLTNDNLCLIHKVKGIEYKPFTCRSFPFKFLYLPNENVQVSYSLTCIGIEGCDNPQSNLSNNLHYVNQEEINNLLINNNNKIICDNFLNFVDNIEISYETLLYINNLISDFLFSPNNASHLNEYLYLKFNFPNDLNLKFNFEKKLVVSYYFIFFLSNLIRKLYDENNQNYLESFINEIKNYNSLMKLLEKCCDIYDKTIIKDYKVMILILFISYKNAILNNMPAFLKAFLIMLNSFKSFLNIGSISIDDGMVINLSEHSKVNFDITNLKILNLVESFISQCIFRKKAFYSQGLLTEYQNILLYYALTKWYAKAYALKRNDNNVNEEDVKKAIILVEKNYSNHSLLLNVLNNNLQFRKIFNLIFSNYSLIKSMVY